MTVYSVYEPPGDDAGLKERADRIAFVKDGFNWPALFVPVLWLIYRRMWLELFVFLAVFLALPVLFGTEPTMQELAGLASLGLTVMFAFEANDLRGWSLRRRGFRFAGTAIGRDGIEAEAAFFTRWLPEQVRRKLTAQPGKAGTGGGTGRAKNQAPALTRPSGGDEVIGSFPRG